MESLDPVPGPITVLMALYQGAEFLQPQLDSIAAQDVDWRLIVADDGSTDAGPRLVRDFAAAHPGRVTLVDGPRQGAAANFRSLLAAAGEARLVALADQDDVWLPDKLARAVSGLSGHDGPALYCSRVTICDADLRPLADSRRPPRPPSFRHALVQNLAQGNTVVLNRRAMDLVQQADPLTPPVVMHDWWLYQLVTGAGGAVIFDPWPSVLYRQHADNVVGANDALRARAGSFARMLSGRHRDWSAQTLAALTPVRRLLTPQNRAVLDSFAALHRGGLPRRLAAMRRGGFYRQGTVSQAALWLAAALGRV